MTTDCRVCPWNESSNIRRNYEAMNFAGYFLWATLYVRKNSIDGGSKVNFSNSFICPIWSANYSFFRCHFCDILIIFSIQDSMVHPHHFQHPRLHGSFTLAPQAQNLLVSQIPSSTDFSCTHQTHCTDFVPFDRVMFRASDLRSSGHEFDSRSGRYQAI